MAGKLVKVRTGPSSYLKLTEKEAAAWRKANQEYGVEPEADAAEAKAEDAPAETKAKSAPAETKARG